MGAKLEKKARGKRQKARKREDKGRRQEKDKKKANWKIRSCTYLKLNKTSFVFLLKIKCIYYENA